MFSRLLLKHSSLKDGKLQQRLTERFGDSGLERTAWKKLSQQYANLDGIEDQFIWGRKVDGHILYGFLKEDPRHTLLWIEYDGESSGTFVHMRRIIENGVYAVQRSQARWQGCAVEESYTYSEVESSPLGITVEINTRGTRLGHFSGRRLFVAIIAFAIALGAGFLDRPDVASGTQQSPEDFFSNLAAYDDPAVYLIGAMILWSAVVMLWGLAIRKVEVTFRA